MGQEDEAVLMSPAAFSWEKAVKATAAVEGRRGGDAAPASPKKAPAARRLCSVPPPPGRAPAMRSLPSRGRAVRPEDDPFLAAYLACTKSSGRRGGGGGGAAREETAATKGGRRRFTWAALGLSCKSSAGAVEQSMVKVARRPELDPRDA